MYDRQTKSLWSQLLGAAVDGPLKGTRLEMLAASFTTWGVWRREHPDGLVLKKLEPSRQTYAGYWQSQDAGILGEKYQDERLKTKQFVLGVRINGQPKAYPYLRLSEQPVVNETFAETPLLVVFDDRSASGAIFERAVAGKTLTFKLAEQTETAPLITDEETARSGTASPVWRLKVSWLASGSRRSRRRPPSGLAGRTTSPTRRSTGSRASGKASLATENTESTE